MDTQISFLPSGEFSKVSNSIGFTEYLNGVKYGRWQDIVSQVRLGNIHKSKAPSVTVSGTFKTSRAIKNLLHHSGFLAMDLDTKDHSEEALRDARSYLLKDPYVYALHYSIRGKGLVVYYKINPTKHLDAFLAIEKYLANTYELQVDPSCKDVSRLRFVSYDPDLHINPGSKKWTKYLPKTKKPPVVQKNLIFGNNDMQFIMDQITQKGINLCEDYHSWLKISFALASEFAEAGRGYFHTISAQSNKYDPKKCDKQYDTSIRYNRQSPNKKTTSIGTFFWYCHNHQIQTKTTETTKVESIAKQRRKGAIGAKVKDPVKATVDFSEKMYGIPEQISRPIADKVMQLTDEELKTQKSGNKMLELENFIGSYDLLFNEVTREIELEGNPITDRDINSIYLNAMRVLDYNINQNKVFKVMESEITPSYNPFLEFFENNKHLKPKGTIDALLDCIDYQKPDFDFIELTEDEKKSDYLEVFLTRWLVSIIAAMHGTYSLLVLVFYGEQCNGKTNFFRNLLPDELQPFRAQSKLEREKEAAALMAKKILIIDDEFGGKSKKDSLAFKELTSTDVFSVRRPYGRVFEDLRRYAVLCGTSNDDTFLNDPTGNRRLIPVEINQIDFKKYNAINKTELFMELYWLWKEIGDSWMLTKKEIAFLNKATIDNEYLSFEEEMILKFFKPAEREQLNAIQLSASEIKMLIDGRTGEKCSLVRIGQLLKKNGYRQFRKKTHGRIQRKYSVIDTYNYTTQKVANF